nr:hypothetical protein [Tanacetum cinerariifolium]
MTSLTSMCELACQIVQKKQEEKQLEEEQAAKAQNWKLPVSYDDDDDEKSSNSLEDNIISELPLCVAITPTEPADSLNIGDEHLDTISATESDEFIKSSVENLFPNPSEFEGENECDVPAGFTTFSNVLFDAEYDFDLEKTYFTKRLLYDNSYPHPPKEFVSENSNADIESFSPSPIPIKDSDSHMEEIDLSFNPDDPMPPSIDEDDDDSERDIPILEELLDNYSLSLPEIELFHFDIPSSYRPPAKPPDGNTRILNIKMMGDISDQKGLEAFQSSAECSMMINGKNTPILDVSLFHFYPLDQLKYGGIRSSTVT